ncbi:MAG: serine/threonine protein kinase [Clostridia bacterium]|nr:serine/threonine protein kinase [Clostridia bacterium]
MKDFDVVASLQEALNGIEDPLPEEIAADWEAMECLGHSERGETLLLYSRKSAGKAVLKLMQGESDDAGPVEKLQMLTHPGLPKVLRAWKDGERLCILREYIEGRTLADTEGNFSESKATDIILQLCDVLSYLHGQTPPLIHRDVKPENILLREDGTIALIDFGIARFYNGQHEKDTRVMGTEHFAPPEQYGFRQTDCRSDLYALGMVLGWMLTGSVHREEYEAIADSNLKRIVKKCTAFSPEDRFSSAIEVKKALSQRKSPRKTLIVTAVCWSAFCCLEECRYLGKADRNTSASRNR